MNTTHSIIAPRITGWYQADKQYPAHLLIPNNSRLGYEWACNIMGGHFNPIGENADTLTTHRWTPAPDSPMKHTTCQAYNQQRDYLRNPHPYDNEPEDDDEDNDEGDWNNDEADDDDEPF